MFRPFWGSDSLTITTFWGDYSADKGRYKLPRRVVFPKSSIQDTTDILIPKTWLFRNFGWILGGILWEFHQPLEFVNIFSKKFPLQQNPLRIFFAGFRWKKKPRAAQEKIIQKHLCHKKNYSNSPFDRRFQIKCCFQTLGAFLFSSLTISFLEGRFLQKPKVSNFSWFSLLLSK